MKLTDGSSGITQKELKMHELPEYFVHFGSDKLDRAKFVEITDASYCGGLKPQGGLWGSNESGHGWRLWCREVRWNQDRLNTKFTFRLKAGARVLNVQGDELVRYSDDTNFGFRHYISCINWQKVKSDYDAVYIAAGSDDQLYMNYYGWDCDSILVLNFDVVEEVE